MPGSRRNLALASVGCARCPRQRLSVGTMLRIHTPTNSSNLSRHTYPHNLPCLICLSACNCSSSSKHQLRNERFPSPPP